MNLNNYKLLIVLVSISLLPGTILIAAETETPTEVNTPEVKTPVEISPVDTIEAGKAEDSFKQANLCEGMEKGDYIGADVCADCHQDKIQTIQASPHGQTADPRSPFGRQGCETCHGPGALHFETEGNCIISMTGRYGESVEQRNEICLDCHKGGERMHWLSSTMKQKTWPV